MSHNEIIGTLNEIIEYFETCAGNAAPISKGRRKFRRWIEALRTARADEMAAMWEGDDGK